MDSTFTEDQKTFAEATRAVLTGEVTAERIRQLEKNAMNKIKACMEA